MGAPMSIFRGQEFTDLVATHGNSLYETAQCVPVVARNPVTCERKGNLARVMNESDPYKHQNYTVVCTIDATKAFEYRTVILHLDNRKTQEEWMPNNKSKLDFNGYTRFLSAGESCTPEVETVGLSHFATALVGHCLPVLESFALDGRINSILRPATSNDDSKLAFRDSKSTLEDVLGVISAIGVSTMNATEGNGTARANVTGATSVDVTGFKLDPIPTLCKHALNC
ncbi:hypothetical protein OQA88_4320 [Cercophora sp. LCS_1]